MSGKVMDPALFSELSHDCVDPRKARRAGRPAFEPDLLFFVVHFVFSRDQLGADIDLAGQVPWDEATVAVVVCLAETPT